MANTKFKVGSVVVNSSGTFAKVLKIKNNVYIATRWSRDIASLKDDTVGNVRFNESAVKICGIKLASKGGKADNDEKPTADAKAEAEAKAKAKAEAGKQSK